MIGENSGQYLFQLKYNYIPAKITNHGAYLGLIHEGIEIDIRDTRNGGFGRSDVKNIVSEAYQIQYYENSPERNATMELLINSTRNTFNIYDAPRSPVQPYATSGSEKSSGEDDTVRNYNSETLSF